MPLIRPTRAWAVALLGQVFAGAAFNQNKVLVDRVKALAARKGATARRFREADRETVCFIVFVPLFPP